MSGLYQYQEFFCKTRTYTKTTKTTFLVVDWRPRDGEFHSSVAVCLPVCGVCSGDILGVLLDLSHNEVIFSLNGNCLPPFKQLFLHAV